MKITNIAQHTLSWPFNLTVYYNILNLSISLFQEYEAQMKAYGIPVQTYTWKPATTNSNNNNNNTTTTTLSKLVASSPRLSINGKPGGSAVSDLEACHLSAKQLEDLMEDDDCQGPVSNGDPMLSSPHLSPHGAIMTASSSPHSGYSNGNSDDALSPTSAADSMDLGGPSSAWQSATGQMGGSGPDAPSPVHQDQQQQQNGATSSFYLATLMPNSANSTSSPLLIATSSTTNAISSSSTTPSIINSGTLSIKPTLAGLPTTLQRREHHQLIDHLELDRNTEKIVANLLANSKKPVVLKERTPCYVVLWPE